MTALVMPSLNDTLPLTVGRAGCFYFGHGVETARMAAARGSMTPASAPTRQR